MKRNPRNVDDEKNKLNLNEFHRLQPNVKKSETGAKIRKQTDKKKLRDIERLLERPGLPQEIKDKKLAELKELKKIIKSKKEAETFSTRYKKIKFVEKRKVMRRLEQLKAQGSDGDKEEMEKLKKQVIYIDNYPSNWKYISLFAKTGDEKKDKETEEKRKINMEKIIQTYNYKI